MSHIDYRLADGTKVPSTTQIIKRNMAPGWLDWYAAMFRIGRNPEEMRDQAGAFGTYTHLCLQHGEPDVDIPNEIKPLLSLQAIEDAHVVLRLFQRWAERHEARTISKERSLVSEKYRYGGTIDWVAVVDGKLTMVDFKTSNNIWPSHFIQLSAYDNLYDETLEDKLEDRFILHLKPDRQPQVYRLPSLSKHWQLFKLLLKEDNLRIAVEEMRVHDDVG